jgi:hypothetical protein
MAFLTDASKLKFAKRGRSKYGWLKELEIGQAKVFESNTKKREMSLRHAVYTFNNRGGNRLSVRKLSNGNLAVIRKS